ADRVLQAVHSLKCDASTTQFTMADMGCADGGTSLSMIERVLQAVHKDNDSLQSCVIYADQPANDFNALVNIVHGRTSFETWLGKFPNAYPLFSGASFYTQAAPTATLDLVFSATAMHWLSAKPCNISNHVHMVGATGAEYDAFAEQGKKDWETILLNRGNELKPGGKAVFANFCRDEAGRHLGNTGGVDMFQTFNEIWQEFLSDGKIEEQEYRNMTLPQYYHTVEEFSAPLTDTNNPVYQAGMRLDDITTGVVRCPFARKFEEDGDVKAFADGLIPTVRSWNQSIFKAGLSDQREEHEKSTLIESYYANYHQRVMDAPEGHGMDYVHAYMTLSRI
nr:class I SAM-dependent methyltransferase [Acidiferrobacterales bacterium]